MAARILASRPTSCVSPNRDAALDVAKGLAIVAVVVGHVAGGLISSGAATTDLSWLREVIAFVYAWHLQTFLLVSGLFVGRGVDREGVSGYLFKRMPKLLWIYVLWTLIQNSAQWLLAGLVNHPVAAAQIAQVWYPTGQMWYIPLLISLTVLVSVSRFWRTGLCSFIGVAGAVLTTLVVADGHTQWFGTQGWGLAVFFTVGVAVGRGRLVDFLSSASWKVVGLGSAVGLIVGLGSTRVGVTGFLYLDRSITMLMSLLTVGGVLALSEVLARSSLRNVTSYVGRASLPIFVAHVIAAAGGRVLLSRLGVSIGAVHLVLGTVLGVSLPLALLRVSSAWRMSWLFEPPRSRRGREPEVAGRQNAVAVVPNQGPGKIAP